MTFDRKAYNKQYYEASYQFYKARGICTVCRERKAFNGRVRCEVCAERQVIYSANRDKDKLGRQFRARRERLSAQGICVNCGKRPAREGCKKCEACERKNVLKTKQWYAAKRVRKPEGLCFRRGCFNEALPGKRTCAEHYPALVQQAARMRAAQDNSDHIWRKLNNAEIARMKRRKRDEGADAR